MKITVGEGKQNTCGFNLTRQGSGETGLHMGHNVFAKNRWSTQWLGILSTPADIYMEKNKTKAILPVRFYVLKNLGLVFCAVLYPFSVKGCCCGSQWQLLLLLPGLAESRGIYTVQRAPQSHRAPTTPGRPRPSCDVTA